MRRYRYLIIILLGVALLAGAAWAWQAWRTVDGRTAAAWLALSQRAMRTVPYRATGATTFQDKPAVFSLAQGAGGRYTMEVVGEDGRRCALGDDGQFVWYRTGGDTVRSAGAPAPATPLAVHSRLLGTGERAGRSTVRLSVWQAGSARLLEIDRETGVVLAMVTREGQREVSRMTIERITYVPVDVEACPAAVSSTIHAATRRHVAELLGTNALEPGWLPAGMKARGIYREWCDCCQQEMAVFRYSDGLRALTLFQVAGDHMCALSEGCHMAPAGGEFIESRRVGKLTVIAVGNLDRATLARVLANLK